MATVTVYFEDCQPFRELDHPTTFRVAIDYTSATSWTFDSFGGIEHPGANGSWVRISPYHELRRALENVITSDMGVTRIEAKIADEIEAEVPDGIGAYKHHREYEVAL